MPDARSPTAGEHLAVACATMAGIGLLRPAPGTWASVAAAGLAGLAIISLPIAAITPVLFAGVVLATVAGLVSAPAAMRRFASGDPAPVVIDEVAGTWLAIALVPGATLAVAPLPGILLGLAFFRVFDIAKPWPVSWFERLPGPLGIMADDLAAGAVAGILAAAVLH